MYEYTNSNLKKLALYILNQLNRRQIKFMYEGESRVTKLFVTEFV